jgi:hypothetical protein
MLTSPHPLREVRQPLGARSPGPASGIEPMESC